MKTQDTYNSITKGVSQQAPADRLEGQMGEQVNLLSDPVRGLVRRNGMVLETQQLTDVSTATDEERQNAATDSNSYRTFTFKVGTNDYDLLYRSRARVGAASAAHLPTIQPVSKFQPRSFMPLVRDPAGLADYDSGGISALTVIGRYVLIAGNKVTPTYTAGNEWGAFANQDKAALYIRTGAYSRTYTVTAKRRSTGQVVTVSYTTPVASYPGTLDVSGLDWTDDDYQKQLNDLTYAFQSAQSEWTATASAAIVPSAIAFQLATQLIVTGFPGWVQADNYIFHDDIEYITVTDGANDESMRVTHNTMEDVSHLSPRHYVGKVVRIQPVKGSDEVYYLKAVAVADGNPTGIQPVKWIEAAGDSQTPDSIMSLATIEDGTMYWAATPALLSALVLAETGVTLAPPQFVASKAGDTESIPPPHFYTTPITLLTVFQDRLLIGSGDTLNLSAIGDYFNFYRGSMLTLLPTDPAEVYALGTEGDVIRKAALYDRNLTLYGDKYHYVITGRQAFDPAAPQLSVQYTIDGTARSQPIGNGPFVYVMKEDSSMAAVQLLQLQAGVWQDSPAVNNVTQQLRDYINGTPAEMVAFSSPSIIFLRTEYLAKAKGSYPKEKPWGLYVYQYLDDAQGQRLTDSWSSWEWSSALGTAIGLADNTSGDGILLYTLVMGVNELGVPTRGLQMLAVSARPDPSGLPYLDGMQRADVAQDTGLWTEAAPAGMIQSIATAVDASRSFTGEPAYFDSDRWDNPSDPNYTVGDSPPQEDDTFRWAGHAGWLSDFEQAFPAAETDYLWTGHQFPAYIDLTNPVMRNHEGKSRNYGRLTLTKLRVTTTRTAGIRGAWTDGARTRVPLLYNSGYERIQYKHSIFVGRDVTNVQIRIGSVDWLPLTINAIAWQGDWNNNQGRRG